LLQYNNAFEKLVFPSNLRTHKTFHIPCYTMTLHNCLPVIIVSILTWYTQSVLVVVVRLRLQKRHEKFLLHRWKLKNFCFAHFCENLNDSFSPSLNFNVNGENCCWRKRFYSMKLLTNERREFCEWCCSRAHCCENLTTKKNP
jgi:hypothetical protein